MTKPSSVNMHTLKFVRKAEQLVAEKGLTDRRDIEDLFAHIFSVASTVIEAFPHSDHAMQRAQLQDSLELYKYAQDAAEKGNDLAELGPLYPDGNRDIVWEFMAGTLLELRDDVRAQAPVTVMANHPGTPELA